LEIRARRRCKVRGARWVQWVVGGRDRMWVRVGGMWPDML
jgi:hypothetical protein